MRARPRRSATLAAVAGVGAVLFAVQPASAHVTVSSTDAVRGGFAVVTFRVPTESEAASTTKVTVSLPIDNPLAFVSVQPHAGWSYTVRQTTLAKPIEVFGDKISKVAGQIVWTADSAKSAVHPGEFEQFNVSVGPLPDVDSLSFPTLQTYSDGTVVRWVEQAAPGSSAEPEHPAPTLFLGGPGEPEPTGSPAPSVVTATAAAEDDGEDDDSNTGTIFGIVGIALGATALAVALRRRPAR